MTPRLTIQYVHTLPLQFKTLKQRFRALPTPLRIISFPLTAGHLHPQSQSLLSRLITFAPLYSAEFFALVRNDVEVGVYACASMVARAVDGVREWDCAEKEEGWMRVEEEEWRVLQVDSGDEEHSSIHPVTASLADARIHCKYQSSYYADFILVKEAQMEETIVRVRECGWTIETGASTPLSTPSGSPSPSPPITCPHRDPRLHSNRYSTTSEPSAAGGEWIMYSDTFPPRGSGRRGTRRPHTAGEVLDFGKRGGDGESPAQGLVVQSLKRGSVGGSLASSFQGLEVKDLGIGDGIGNSRRGSDDELPEGKDAGDSLASSGVLSPSMAVSHVPEPSATNEQTHPPTEPPTQTFHTSVSVLGSKIAVIGLNKDTERQWEHRVQVFLNFPEEQARVSLHASITTPERQRGGAGAGRPFVSYIRTEEGTSLSTEIPIIRSLFRNDEERESLVQSGGELGMFDSEDDDEPSSSHIRDSSTASSSRSKGTADSGYGSAFSTPWIDASVEVQEGTSLVLDSGMEEDGGRERRMECGVKRCLQLDFRAGDGEEWDDGLDQTKLIAKVSGRLQRQGLGLLYASTSRSANILVESRYLNAARRILDEVVRELDGQ